jgi:membrane protein DedA with SNARE-associated domain
LPFPDGRLRVFCPARGFELEFFDFLSHMFLEHSYLAVFGVLLLCGLGLPLPEEITLIAAGVAVYEGRAELVPMMVVTVVGILVGDSILFYFGRRYGPNLLLKPFVARLLHVDRMNKVRREFERHGTKSVFFGRFFAGIRGLVFFTAGTLGMRFRTFLLLDLLGALLSAPISVWLGCHFGAEIERLLSYVKQFDRALLLILAGFILYLVIRNWRTPKANAPPPGPETM